MATLISSYFSYNATSVKVPFSDLCNPRNLVPSLTGKLKPPYQTTANIYYVLCTTPCIVATTWPCLSNRCENSFSRLSARNCLPCFTIRIIQAVMLKLLNLCDTLGSVSWNDVSGCRGQLDQLIHPMARLQSRQSPPNEYIRCWIDSHPIDDHGHKCNLAKTSHLLQK